MSRHRLNGQLALGYRHTAVAGRAVETSMSRSDLKAVLDSDIRVPSTLELRGGRGEPGAAFLARPVFKVVVQQYI